MKDYGKTFWTFTGLILFAVSAQLVRAQSDFVSLAPASKLIGMDIRTNDDRQAGTIEYLMIEGNSGDVRLALVSPGGELELEEGQLVAVPFSNLDVRSVDDQEIVATVSLAQLQGATTIAEDEVSTLAEPLVVTEVYDYYGTPEERDRMQMRSGDNQQGARNEDRQPQSNRPDDNQPGDMNQRPDEDDPLANLREEPDPMETDQEALEDMDEEEYGEEQVADMDADVDADMDADAEGGVQADIEMEADADLDMQDEHGDEERTAAVDEEDSDADAQVADRREEERRQAQQQGDQQMATEQQARRQGQPQQQGETPADHMVLVARNVVSVVIPGLQPAEQMLGAPVRTPSDEEFGDIDEIVLNLDKDRVAYVLISHGGFLGIGEEWFAMPIEKLRWNAQEQRFTTDVDAESVEVFRGLPKTDLPARVSQSELDDFYRSYGVTRTDNGMNSNSEDRDGINQ